MRRVSLPCSLMMAISWFCSSSVDHRSMVMVSDAVVGRLPPVGRELVLMAKAVNSSTAWFCAETGMAAVMVAAVRAAPMASVKVLVLIIELLE